MKILEIISDILISLYNRHCDARNLELIRRLKKIVDALHKYKNYTDSFEYSSIHWCIYMYSIEFSDNIKVNIRSSPDSTVCYEYSRPQDISKPVQELILNMDMRVVRLWFDDMVRNALKSHIKEGNREEVIKDLKFCLQNFIF